MRDQPVTTNAAHKEKADEVKYLVVDGHVCLTVGMESEQAETQNAENVEHHKDWSDSQRERAPLKAL